MQIGIRTQQIIQDETGITDVVDPLGGSYYVESLTDDIERLGGYVSAVESGQLHRKISGYFTNQQREIEQGDIKIVAYNRYTSDAAPPPINVFSYPEGVEARQRERLAKLRLSRDSQRVESSLAALEDACRTGKNILPFSVACARARCTEGELFKVFKKSFGLWKPPALW